MPKLILATAIFAATVLVAVSAPTFRPSSRLNGALDNFEFLEASVVEFEPLRIDGERGMSMQSVESGKSSQVYIAKFSGFGEDFRIPMKKNTRLFHSEYFERTYSADGKPIDTPLSSERDCHYLYSAEDDEEGTSGVTFSALSTCNGVHGLFHHEGEAYFIEPAHVHVEGESKIEGQAAHAGSHILYRVQDLKDTKATCGVATNPEAHGHLESIKPGNLGEMGAHSHGSVADAHGTASTIRALNVADKIVDLVIVNDFARYDEYGENTHTHSASVVNIVHGLYLNGGFSPSIAINLRAQVSWSAGDPISPASADGNDDEVDVDDLLYRFTQWRNNELDVNHDNAHLLSSLDFAGSIVGYAGVSVMCTSSSTGIDEFTFSDAFNAATLAHEMGHNFGMQHDDDSCTPEDGIMSAVGTYNVGATEWTDCSRSYLSNFFATSNPTCMNDVQSISWDGSAVCGNGFVEDGESCDCGSDDCSSIDSCCDGSTCQLVDGAECSDSDPCCSSCSIVSAGSNTVCRAAVHSTCDMAETCDGTSPKCPHDVVVGSGFECSGGKCYRGECITHDDSCSSSVNSEWEACSTQKSRNGGDFCENLWCYQTGTASNLCASVSSTTPVGVSCGSSKQCDGSGSCVSSSALTEFEWIANEWGICECWTQARTFYCGHSDYPGVEVDEDACYGMSKGSLTQSCSNYTEGCPAAPSSASGETVLVSIGGTDVTMDLLLYAVLAVIALFSFCLFCCYKSVTYGRPRWQRILHDDKLDGSVVARESLKIQVSPRGQARNPKQLHVDTKNHS